MNKQLHYMLGLKSGDMIDIEKTYFSENSATCSLFSNNPQELYNSDYLGQFHTYHIKTMMYIDKFILGYSYYVKILLTTQENESVIGWNFYDFLMDE